MAKFIFYVARKYGIENLFQPGLIKEMIIADILGHELITTKGNSDAHDKNNSSTLYEYLSCAEKGTGQIDRVMISPEKIKKSYQS